MTPTPISTVAAMRAGSVIEMIAGEFTKIYSERKEGSNDHGDWSMQTGTFKDDHGDTIKIQFKNRDIVPQSWIGQRVEITTVGDKKSKGICVDEYQGVKRLVLYPTVEFAWITGERQAPAPDHRHDGPPARREDPPARLAPPTETRQQAPAARREESAPIHGATVGMALNQASRILTESVAQADRLKYFLSRKYLLDLYAMASGIVRVSQHMERGYLAAPIEEPAPRQAADPDKPETWNDDPERKW